MKGSWDLKRTAGLLLSVMLTVLTAKSAWAASYFIADTISENGISAADARVATLLVKDSVTSRSGDSVVNNEALAGYVLQPRLMKLGDSYVLTVEKSRGDEVLFAAQSKVSSADQLDRAARSATRAAIEEPSAKSANVAVIRQPPSQHRSTVIYEVPADGTVSATTIKHEDTSPAIYGETKDLAVTGRRISYWTVGFGPAFANHLGDESVMYSFAAGRVWDINPKVDIKLIGEANLSSGDNGARLFNIATGANFFLPETSADTAPYLTADLGWGATTNADNADADGVSVGAGVGFQFFRTTETTMDALVRYVRILNKTDRNESNPSVLGARLAVNF